MDLDIAKGQPGSELQYEVKVLAGKVVLSVGYTGKGGTLTVAGQLDPDTFIDKLAEAIPGKIDDAVLGMLKAALKM
jgi:hypothetical protein